MKLLLNLIRYLLIGLVTFYIGCGIAFLMLNGAATLVIVIFLIIIGFMVDYIYKKIPKKLK